IYNDDDAVARRPYGSHPRALGQPCRGFDGTGRGTCGLTRRRPCPSLGAENTVADDGNHDRDAEDGGEPGDEHQPATARDDLGLRRGQLVILVKVGIVHGRSGARDTFKMGRIKKDPIEEAIPEVISEAIPGEGAAGTGTSTMHTTTVGADE